MRSTTKYLATYLTSYCIAHSDMVDAEFAISIIKDIGASIRLDEATQKFEKAKGRLISKVPENINVYDILADFSIMIQEAVNDTAPDEE